MSWRVLQTGQREVGTGPQRTRRDANACQWRWRPQTRAGIGEEFAEELSEALAIVIKLLTTPYIDLSVPYRLQKNPHIYAEEVFATADYNERFGYVVRTIVDRGVGEGALPALAIKFTARLDGPRPAGLSDRALIYGAYEYACASGLSKEKRQIEKAFAESADGDVVAAHIAFGNDYLCTEDRGGSALSPSIFDAENRAWLKTEYGVEILNVQQLASLLACGRFILRA